MRRLFAFLLSLIAAPVAAQSEIELTEVDVELFLAVDVSRSMSPYELEIQRKGYAAAMASEEVKGTIAGGMIGRIAVPERVANLTFGGQDGRDLLMCGTTSLYRFRVNVTGARDAG